MLITSMQGFSSNQAMQLAAETREKLSDDLFTVYLPEEEYILLKEGLLYDSIHATKLSEETKKKIKETLNVRYLLDVKLLNNKTGDSYGFYTNNELNRYEEPYNRNQETNTASALFTVTDLEQPSDNRSFTVKVNINPLIIDEEEGEQRVNVTDGNTASLKAYRKGIKRIKKSIF
ncbi:hypothetical protein GCM10011506_22910 [Marivirga lumbricoides]|uniref:Uncharacterized protein n=2 Tax=Marivirga lumbricoides TaxID=1046115 RepID=A0ABQ1M9E0_9BACT|nr:hypothetical protein GCM10011506_22910 [Marivirga lumbricoides]